jgi:hypothetical protein
MIPDTLTGNIYQLLRCGSEAGKMNKQYTKEFIEETIALIRAQSYSVSEAATIGDRLSIIQ